MNNIGSVLVDTLKAETEWVCEQKLHRSVQLHGRQDLKFAAFRTLNIIRLIRRELRKRKENMRVLVDSTASSCKYKIEARSATEESKQPEIPNSVEVFRNRQLLKMSALTVNKTIVCKVPHTEAFEAMMTLFKTALQDVKFVSVFNPVKNRKVCVKEITAKDDCISLHIVTKFVSVPFFVPPESEPNFVFEFRGRDHRLLAKVPLGVLFYPWLLTESKSHETLMREWTTALGRYIPHVAAAASVEALCTDFATSL